MIYNGKPLFLAMVQIMFHSCCLACFVIGIINTNLNTLANLPRQNPSHPLNEMLGRPQGQCGPFGEENKLLSLPGLALNWPAHSPVTVLII